MGTPRRATGTILVSAKSLDRSLVGRRRRRRAGCRRLLAVRPLVPVLHPLVDGWWNSVAVTALVTPPAAAPVPPPEEREPQQPEEDDQDEQEPEEAEDAEAPVRAVAVVVRRRDLSAGGQMRRDTVGPPDVVGDYADDGEQDGRGHQPDQTETASHVKLPLCIVIDCSRLHLS